MGCWSATSLLTKLPILENEPVACFILKTGEVPEFPIFGLYDDYGRIKKPIEDSFSHRFLSDRLGKNYFFNKKIEGYDKSFYLSTKYMEEVDYLIGHDMCVMVEKDLYYKFSLLSKEEMEFFRLAWKIDNPEFFKIEMEAILKDNLAILKEEFKFELLSPEDEKRLIYLSTKQYFEPLVIGKERLQYLRTYDIDDYVEEYARFTKFYHFIKLHRRDFIHHNDGSQEEDWTVYKLILKESLKKVDKRIGEILEKRQLL